MYANTIRRVVGVAPGKMLPKLLFWRKLVKSIVWELPSDQELRLRVSEVHFFKKLGPRLFLRPLWLLKIVTNPILGTPMIIIQLEEAKS